MGSLFLIFNVHLYFFSFYFWAQERNVSFMLHPLLYLYTGLKFFLKLSYSGFKILGGETHFDIGSFLCSIDIVSLY